MAKLKRTKCSKCGRSVAIAPNGRLYNHKRQKHLRKGVKAICPGSGDLVR